VGADRSDYPQHAPAGEINPQLFQALAWVTLVKTLVKTVATGLLCSPKI
jgi:hypothetical protein